MKPLVVIIGLLITGCNLTDQKSVNDKQEKTNQIENRGIALQNGDLIFHTSQSNQSEAIQIVTNSKYSHMGIIYREGNMVYVYEAVQPVKITKLNDWINRGENGRYVVKRLKNSDRILTEKSVQKMKIIGRKYWGKDYDLRFEWSDDKIYCSELVWKIYKETFNVEIGELERIGDFDLSEKSVQAKVKARYGDKVPKDELIITPDRMFNSNNLITIIEK